MKTINLAMAAVTAIGLTFSEAAMAIEEPRYDIIEKSENIEIRQYRPFIVAETLVEGKMDEASNAGFRLIAGYIFGNNLSVKGPGDQTSEKIAMTAPVTVQPAASFEKIAMTAPVTIEPQNVQDAKAMQASRWRVHFVMPAEYSLATLPRPRNAAVNLREVPGKRYAALTFSGLAGDEKAQQKTGELLSWLQARTLVPAAPPQLARYDPPWTLPFFRRNEILIEIAAP